MTLARHCKQEYSGTTHDNNDDDNIHTVSNEGDLSQTASIMSKGWQDVTQWTVGACTGRRCLAKTCGWMVWPRANRLNREKGRAHHLLEFGVGEVVFLLELVAFDWQRALQLLDLLDGLVDLTQANVQMMLLLLQIRTLLIVQLRLQHPLQLLNITMPSKPNRQISLDQPPSKPFSGCTRVS